MNRMVVTLAAGLTVCAGQVSWVNGSIFTPTENGNDRTRISETSGLFVQSDSVSDTCSSVLVGWGSASVPVALTSVKQVSAGGIGGIESGAFGLALNENGTLVSWGRTYEGLCEAIPEGLTEVVQVDAGTDHCLALKSDGTVVAWGANWDGQCNVPIGLSGVIAVSAGYSSSLALKSDGTVVAWGANWDGQCNVPAGLSGVIAVSAGNYFSLALKSDGTVVAWGANGYGQCSVPAGLSDVIAVSSGSYFNLALKTDGTVVAWGGNSSGQCTVPAGLSDVIAVSAGDSFSLALKSDGTVVAWGENYSGQCRVPAGLDNVRAIDARAFSLALYEDGTVVAWGGYNSGGELDVVQKGWTDVRQVCQGPQHALAVMGDGSVKVWGLNESGQCNVPQSATNILSGAAGGSFSLAVSKTGKVLAWGENWYGQCNVPVAATNIVSVAAGWSHSLALRQDGVVLAWGDNSSGQCSVPLGLIDAVSISAYDAFSLVTKSDGTVVSFGDPGYYGTDRSVPASLSHVASTAMSSVHCLALHDRTTLSVWGENNSGECTVPAGLSNVVSIAAGYGPDSNWNNAGFSVALKSDGTVIQWGAKQLYDTSFFSSPLVSTSLPDNLSNVVAISASGTKALAIVRSQFNEVAGVAIAMQPESDTGVSNSDFITTNTCPQFVVTVQASGTLHADFDGDGAMEISRTVESGQSVIQPEAPLADGSYWATVEFDAPGFLSGSARCRFVIDTTSPVWSTKGAPVVTPPVNQRPFDFSEWDLAMPLTSSNFVFSGPVNRTVVYDASAKTLSFDPIYLAGDYTIFLTNVLEVAGNPVAGADAFEIIDDSKPYWISTSPVVSSTSITNLVLVFSEPILFSDIDWVWVETEDGTLVRPVSVLPSPDDPKCLVISFPALVEEGRYNLVFDGTKISDLNGNGFSVRDLVFVDDFERQVDASWSTATTEIASGIRYLGRFGNQTVSLSITNLPASALGTAIFDVLVLDSWDGGGSFDNGPDLFRVLTNGVPALEYNFNAVDLVHDATLPGNLSNTSSSWSDYVYRDISVPIRSDPDGNLLLQFAGSGLQGVSDESWGLDNVRVFVDCGNTIQEQLIVVDHTPPSVSSMSLSGQIVSGVVTAFDLVFNETMKSATVSIQTVFLNRPDGQNVAPLSIVQTGATAYHVEISGQTQPGVYEIIVDGAEDVAENICVYRGTFTVTQPDLVVTRLTGPTQSLSGQRVQLSWTLSNNGAADFTGSFTDYICLSEDMLYGNDPQRFEFVFTGSIPVGGSVQRIQEIDLPKTLVGSFYWLAYTDGTGVVPELDEENNLLVFQNPAVIEFHPYPNLKVSSITEPAQVYSSQATEISWEVENAGNGAVNATKWQDKVWLSPDAFLDETDTYLGQVDNPSFLNEGEHYRNSLTSTMPKGISGNYYFIIKTDGNNAVDEYGDEGDNQTVSDPVLITMTPVPDLFVTTVTAPGNVFSGTEISVNWAVTNRGAGRTLESVWRDNVYLSSDTVLDGSDWYMGTKDHSEKMEPNDDYATSLKVKLPTGVAGDYYFIVKTDADDQVFEHVLGNNNTTSQRSDSPTHISLTPPPDLVVEALAVPATARAGTHLSISYRVANRGASATPESRWTDRIYLSDDNTLDTENDLQLGAVTHYGMLAPGGSQFRNLSYTLPQGMEGNRWVFVTTDAEDVVFELDNANNTSGADQRIAVSYLPADLIVPAFQAPELADAGSTVPISFTVFNQGVGDTIGSTWNCRVYLSNDDQIGNDEILTTLTREGLLAAGEGFDKQKTVEIPLSTPPGNYCIYFATDVNGQIHESDESNNASAMRTIAISRNVPDLRVSNFTINGSPLSGEPLELVWNVVNAGNAATTETWWYDDIYLSANGAIEGSDTRLARVQHSDVLQPGQSYTRTNSVALPQGIEGPFYLILKTDGSNLVIETPFEDNNTATGRMQGASPDDPDEPIHVVVPPVPDLAMENVDAPVAAWSGRDFEVNWTVTNIGEVTEGTWYDSVYLSRDQIFDVNADTYVGSVTHISGLISGASYSITHTFQMPRELVGPYWVFVKTDGNGRIYEGGSEFNNAACDPSYVDIQYTAPADLLVGTITVPASAIPGQAAAFTITVRNQGENSAFGSWYDSVYLSADETWSIDDAFFARVSHNGTLDAGAEYTFTAHGALPGVVPGDYHVIVRTDIGNFIAESDENNNITASLDEVAVDAEELPQGASDQDRITTGGAVYYRFTAQAGQTFRISAVADNSSAALELYAAEGRMPSRGSFDVAANEPYVSECDLYLPASETGEIYAMLYNAGTVSDYTVTCEAIPFSIVDIGQTEIGNAGTATLTIHGALFTTNTQFGIVGDGLTMLSPTRVLIEDSTTAFATFETWSLSNTVYDLVAINPDANEQVTFAGAVSVADGGSAEVELDYDGALSVRPNRVNPLRISWGNTGNQDTMAPLILLRSTGNAPMGFAYSDLQSGDLHVLGTPTEGFIDTLAPGSLNNQLIYYCSPSSGTDFDIRARAILAGDTTPLTEDDWLSIEANMRPSGLADAEWNAFWANIRTRMPETWGGYVQMLNAMAGNVGETVRDVRELTTLQYQLDPEFLPVYGGIVSGFLLNTQGQGISNGVVTVTDGSGENHFALSGDTGRYSFLGLPDGTNTVVAEADGYTRTQVGDWVIPTNNPIISQDIILAPEGSVSATVSSSCDGETVVYLQSTADASITGFFMGELVDGQLLVGNLPAGEYALSITRAGCLPFSQVVTISESQSLNLGNLGLIPAAHISGQVVYSGSGVGAADQIVELLNGDAQVSIAITDDNGMFSFTDLVADSYTVRVTVLDGFAETASADVTAGEQLDNLILQVRPGGTITGLVTDDNNGNPLVGVSVFAMNDRDEQFVAETDDSGRYAFQHLGLGDYAVYIPGHSTTQQIRNTVSDLNGQTFTNDFSIGYVGIIKGLLQDAEGNPLTGTVSLYASSNRVVSTFTDSSGEFSFLIKQAGEYEVCAASNCGTFNHTNVVISVGNVKNIILSGGSYSVNVDIIYPHGIDVVKTVVKLYELSAGKVPIDFVLLDGESSAVFQGLNSGQYELCVATDKHIVRQDFSINGNNTSVTAILSESYSLSGMLLDDGGHPISKGLIFVCNDKNEIMKSCLSDSSGLYRVGGVGAGRYTVIATSDSNTTCIKNISINSDYRLNVTIKNYQYMAIGKVVDEFGTPVAGASINILDCTGQIIGFASTTMDGCFTVPVGNTNDISLLSIKAIGWIPCNKVLYTNLNNLGTITLEPYAVPRRLNFNITEQGKLDDSEPNRIKASVSQVPRGYKVNWFTPPSIVYLHHQNEVDFGDIDPLRCRECASLRAKLLDEIVLEKQAFNTIQWEISELLWNWIRSGGIVSADLLRVVGVGAVIISLAGSEAELTSYYVVSSIVSGISSLVQDYLDAASGSEPPSALRGLSLGVNTKNNILQILTTSIDDAPLSAYTKKWGVLGQLISIKSTIESLQPKTAIDYINKYIEACGKFDMAVDLYLSKVSLCNELLHAYKNCNSKNCEPCRISDMGERAHNQGCGIKYIEYDYTNCIKWITYKPCIPPPADPNDILGPTGFGEDRWVSIDRTLDYTIRFENDPVFAEAPAQEVRIRQVLDADIDPYSFRLGNFGFGDVVVEVPENRAYYSTRLDLRGSRGIYLDVAAGVDIATREVFWVFTSIDPDTGVKPLDAFTGFLPVNTNAPAGEGWVTYTVKPKAATTTGSRIDAMATIEFDTEAPIDTPPIFNTIDAAAPSSAVAELPSLLPATTTEFPVSWGGNDDSNGSALAHYNVYVRVNGGAWELWQNGTTKTSATFTGSSLNTYDFYSVAADNVNNTESAPSEPDTTVYIQGGDLDNDGMPDEWEKQIVNVDPNDAITTSNEVLRDDDFDGDGYSNWSEYVSGSDPKDKQSVFHVSACNLANGEMIVKWMPSLEGRRYRVLRSDAVTTPFTNAVADVDGPADTAKVFCFGSQGYFRVAVDLTNSSPQWVVSAVAEANGRISPKGLQYVTAGSNTLVFAITPVPWYHVTDVTVNGVSTGAITHLVLSNIVVNTDVIARFAPNMVTNAPVDVPEYWLADFGWTNDFTVVVTNDIDGDRTPNWLEYATGSSPTNARSAFGIKSLEMVDKGYVVRWTPAKDSSCDLYWSPLLIQPYTLLSPRIGYPCGAYTDTVHRASPSGFYKVILRPFRE